MRDGFVRLGINDNVYLQLTPEGLMRVGEILGKRRYDKYKEKTLQGKHITMCMGEFMLLFGEISGRIGDTWTEHVNTPVYFCVYEWPKPQKDVGIDEHLD